MRHNVPFPGGQARQAAVPPVGHGDAQRLEGAARGVFVLAAHRGRQRRDVYKRQMAESKSLRIAYGEALAELGAENDKIVVLDADLSNATMTLSLIHI